MREDAQRLRDILEAITRIEKYAARGREAFESDELIQNWIVNHLQIIGEACRSMTEQLRDRNPQIPWDQIIGMRHILVHQYFGIDTDIVWSVVQDDRAELRHDVEQLLAASGS